MHDWKKLIIPLVTLTSDITSHAKTWFSKLDTRLRLICKFSAWCQEVHFTNVFPKLTSKLNVRTYFFSGQVELFSSK